MTHIDERFKDNTPEKTVENIINILNSVGIKLTEKWTDSGIENCYSLRVSVNGVFPGTNGKGVTPALARASAYGEFIERLQTNLLLYKYQSLENDPEFLTNAYAPDAKYMTRAELIENGEWMDHVIAAYGGRLTREELAEQCEMYAGSEKILTLPFYSMFEDKYVYLPSGFVEHIYASNGCCAGNTREEAMIHALSEILERNATIKMLLSGDAAPVIPDEILKQYDSVYSTIKILRDRDMDVTVLDFSHGIDFPIVATRLINKKTGGYIISIGADPVFEIAIKRTITEVLQGKSITTLKPSETYGMLNSVRDTNAKCNVTNQLETGNGYFTVNFFSDDVGAKRKFCAFTDNSNKTNREIIPEMLQMFKKMGRPVYARNCAFLGFPCYMVVVPGFSEIKGLRLNEILQEYAFGEQAAPALRYPERASDDELSEMMLYYKMISPIRSRKANYNYISGIPFNSAPVGRAFFTYIHMAYAAFRLKKTKDLLRFLSDASKVCMDTPTKEYTLCLLKYFSFLSDGHPEEQILYLLKKFCTDKAYARFINAKESNAFFEGLLLRCDKTNCDNCSNKSNCYVADCKDMIRRVGKEYAKFTNGQAKENFVFEF